VIDSSAEREHAMVGDAGSASPGDQLRWLRKWVLLILGGFAVILFPWSAFLALTLPSRHLTPHWDAAWAGFDLMMAGVVLWTVVSILRRSKYVAVAASVTGTFLICDAWFDLLTSRPGPELVESSLFAILGELPLAGLCFWLARDAENSGERTTGYFERRRSRRQSLRTSA
jgi:hypothetical protein